MITGTGVLVYAILGVIDDDVVVIFLVLVVGTNGVVVAVAHSEIKIIIKIKTLHHRFMIFVNQIYFSYYSHAINFALLILIFIISNLLWLP